MSDLVKIAALWINEGKGGIKYMSGYLGDAKLLVFRNKYKDEKKHPDFLVYVSKKDKRDQADTIVADATRNDDDDEPPF